MHGLKKSTLVQKLDLSSKEMELIALAVEFLSYNRSQAETFLQQEIELKELLKLDMKLQEYRPELDKTPTSIDEDKESRGEF
jgi:hypothetical protein